MLCVVWIALCTFVMDNRDLDDARLLEGPVLRFRPSYNGRNGEGMWVVWEHEESAWEKRRGRKKLMS